MKYLFLIITLLGNFVGLAQTTAEQTNTTVRINEESSIREMLDHRKTLNFDQKRKIKAWSVQVFLTREKYLAAQKTSAIRNQFKHLNHKVDWFYANPYYRIYTGSFYTKIEAAGLLNQLVKEYPDAIIFKNSEAKPENMF